jgi:hypothetical protein
MQILKALELPTTRAIPEGLHITNRGLNNWPKWASEKFDELFTIDERECRDLFIRACAESDADFGSQAANGDPNGGCRNGKRGELATLGAMGCEAAGKLQ